MRDPTSLFPSLGFPRGGLCLRCSRVPFALPFLFVLPWLGWEGMLLLLYRFSLFVLWLAYLFSSSCFLSYPFFLAQPSLPCLTWLCRATAALGGFSVSALSVSCPCLSSVLGQNAVLYVLGEFFCIPCATRLSSLWITPYFLWISTYLLCTNILIFIVLSYSSFRSFYMLSSYEAISLFVSFPVFLVLFLLFFSLFFFSFFWERLLAGASFPRYLATYSKALSVSSSPLQPKSTQLAISGDLASPCIPHFVRNRSLSFDAIPQYMFYQQISTANPSVASDLYILPAMLRCALPAHPFSLRGLWRRKDAASLRYAVSSTPRFARRCIRSRLSPRPHALARGFRGGAP